MSFIKIPAIVCLQETKLALITDRDVLAILGQEYLSFVYLPAQETRGGILVAWKSDFVAECNQIHRHSVSVKFQAEGEQAWWFSGINGPHLDTEKPAFLEELQEGKGPLFGALDVGR